MSESRNAWKLSPEASFLLRILSALALPPSCQMIVDVDLFYLAFLQNWISH